MNSNSARRGLALMPEQKSVVWMKYMLRKFTEAGQLKKDRCSGMFARKWLACG